MTIALINGGTRMNGNTEILTKYVVKGLEVEKIDLIKYHIQPIIDLRHDPEGFKDVEDDCNSIINRILPHDILLFSTPIYFYSMSGVMKNFIDRWSHVMRDAKYPDFKSKMATKKAYVIAVGGDEPNIKGLPLIQQFQYIFQFMGISFEGYILGSGNKPDDIFKDEEAIFSAKKLRDKLAIKL